jgi:hypothetical protein
MIDRANAGQLQVPWPIWTGGKDPQWSRGALPAAPAGRERGSHREHRKTKSLEDLVVEPKSCELMLVQTNLQSRETSRIEAIRGDPKNTSSPLCRNGFVVAPPTVAGHASPLGTTWSIPPPKLPVRM